MENKEQQNWESSEYEEGYKQGQKDMLEKIRKFDVKYDTLGNPVKNPLMKLNDIKNFLLEDLSKE